MEKLMDTDPYNRAIPKKLIGDDMFGDTYPTCSTTCQKQTDCDDCPIQEAFARLRQYEQAGLAPEQIRELKERDTAKEIQKVDEQPYFRKRFHSYICPVCHKKVEFGWLFCGYCGQKLKRKD